MLKGRGENFEGKKLGTLENTASGKKIYFWSINWILVTRFFKGQIILNNCNAADGN